MTHNTLMVCRECGFEPEESIIWSDDELPLGCPECGEHALRPQLGLAEVPTE